MRHRVLIFSLGLLLCAAPMAQAQLFGPSDDEKAHEQNEDYSMIRWQETFWTETLA